MSSSVGVPLSSETEVKKVEEHGEIKTEDAEEKLRDELIEVPVCSVESNGEEKDVEEDGEVSGGTSDDEEEKEEKDMVVIGPQVTLKEQLELDKDDDSLRRWKEKLLGSLDLSALGEIAEPEVKILSLTIISENRPDIVLPLPFTENDKGFAFTLKDGSHYRIRFTFTVSNNIVSGLKYMNTVWKTGIKVDSTKVMLGTFSPRSEPYTYELDEEKTPSGYFARGSYAARTKFVDDDGKHHLDLNYHFEIRKEWPAS